MQGPGSAAASVDESDEGWSRPPRRLRRHPSSREEGKADHPAAFGGTPPQERRGKPTTPPPSAAPPLKRGGEPQNPSSAFFLPMRSATPCIASASHPSNCPPEQRSSSAAPRASTEPAHTAI